MLFDPDDHWKTPKRLADLKRAYEIGMRETPAEVRRQAGYEVEQFLSGILPALLQVCIVQAASTALGATVGAIIGAFFGGVGAAPGAAYGASLGFSISATVLAWLGLAFLFVAVGKGLIDMAVLVQQAVVRAWKAADHPSDQRSWEVQQAGRDLARAMGMLMLLVLQAVVAWVLKKGIDKKAELLAELRKSKLGEGFAKWVDENLDRLMSDPRLRGHRGEGSSAKAPEEPAKSPSQIKREREEEAAATRPVDAQTPAKSLVNQAHIAELKSKGTKFSPDNVVATGKRADGQLVFLEKGNSRAGLQHIVEAHGDDFARAGIAENQIPEVVVKAAAEGNIVGYQGAGTGRPIYQTVVNGQPINIAVTTGTNGFIVGANPAGRVP